MPYVTLHPLGGGEISFRGTEPQLISDTLSPAQSRETAIAMLVAHAVQLGEVIDVEVSDVEEHLTLWVHPDGQVIVVASNNRPQPAPAPTPAVFAPLETTIEDTDTPARGTALTPVPEDDFQDETAISARRAPTTRVTLHFDDGDPVTFTQTTVLGRAPRPQPRYGDCALVSIPDAQGSVSKTHCIITVVHEVVELIDLESTNGTDVEREGKEWPSPPGTPVVLHDGDTVHLGDSAALVRLVRAGPGDA